MLQLMLPYAKMCQENVNRGAQRIAVVCKVAQSN